MKSSLMWVTDGSGNKINVYQLGQTTPIEEIAGNDLPYAVSIQNKGKPLGTAVISDIDTKSVYVFKPGTYTPYAVLTNGVSLPGSLLITKP